MHENLLSSHSSLSLQLGLSFSFIFTIDADEQKLNRCDPEEFIMSRYLMSITISLLFFNLKTSSMDCALNVLAMLLVSRESFQL